MDEQEFEKFRKEIDWLYMKEKMATYKKSLYLQRREALMLLLDLFPENGDAEAIIRLSKDNPEQFHKVTQQIKEVVDDLFEWLMTISES